MKVVILAVAIVLGIGIYYAMQSNELKDANFQDKLDQIEQAK